jgi:hypothetical protein
LTVHVFKEAGRKELVAVEQALGGRSIPFALVHINRTSPLWLIEDTGRRIAPAPRGSVVRLSEYDYLLTTGDPSKKRTLHPLRLTVNPRSTFRDMQRITTQIYGFTTASLRSFHQANEPSTILYGRLLAEKIGQLVPYGFQADLAAGIGDRPWFL